MTWDRKVSFDRNSRYCRTTRVILVREYAFSIAEATSMVAHEYGKANPNFTAKQFAEWIRNKYMEDINRWFQEKNN